MIFKFMSYISATLLLITKTNLKHIENYGKIYHERIPRGDMAKGAKPEGFGKGNTWDKDSRGKGRR